MPTSLMDIVAGCENFLGWKPPYQDDVEPRRTLSLEAYKLRRALEAAPSSQSPTLANLALALEYSRRKQLPIKSPAVLLHRINDALALTYREPALTDVAAQVATAIRWEQDRDDTESLKWIHRLARSAGPGRAEVLDEWKRAGRG